MAASVIQVVHAENVTAGGSIAVAITPTAGNSLIACVAFEDNTTLSSVKNTAGTAFHIDQTRDGTNEGEWLTISSLFNVAGVATTITATFAANANCCRGIQVLEVAGVAAASSGSGLKLSGTPAGNDSGAGTAASFDTAAASTVTTTDDGALVVAYGEGDTHQPVVAGAYSLGANDTTNFLTTEYQVQGTHGAVNPSYTMSVADKWSVVIAAYAPASGGSAATDTDSDVEAESVTGVSAGATASDTIIFAEPTLTVTDAQGTEAATLAESTGSSVVGVTDADPDIFAEASTGTAAVTSQDVDIFAESANAVLTPTTPNDVDSWLYAESALASQTLVPQPAGPAVRGGMPYMIVRDWKRSGKVPTVADWQELDDEETAAILSAAMEAWYL